MKKTIVFLGMLTISSVMFAQQFFIDGNVDTNFESVIPTIGIGIRTRPVDIMAGINLTISEDGYEYGSPYSDYAFSKKWSSVGIYAGIAPKAISTEKLTISFPLLAQIRFGESSGEDYKDARIPVQFGDLENSNRFGFDFLAGVRAAYSLSEQWSIFAGFVFNIVEYTNYENTYYRTTSQTGGTYSRKESFTGWLNGGKVQLGARFTI
ncbi:MAG: hypothetical protein LBH85_09305 [Treponema sp.]|jgi:hypothetical protein|nr:hypothetical protein [Treponema sp.]